MINDVGFNQMQTVKRRFFAMRNGVIADALRRGGSKFRVIFGLNLPQLREIAAEIGENRELGEALWHNNSTRESMMLAPMILPKPNELTDELFAMTAEVPDSEIADILCHTLLSPIDRDGSIMRRLAVDPLPMRRYMGLRMLYGRVAEMPKEAEQMARAELERGEALTRPLATLILDDALFWQEE